MIDHEQTRNVRGLPHTEYSRGRAFRNRRIKTSYSALSTFQLRNGAQTLPTGRYSKTTDRFTPCSGVHTHTVSLRSTQFEHRIHEPTAYLATLVFIGSNRKVYMPSKMDIFQRYLRKFTRGASCWRLISASRHSRCECLSNQHVFV